jgi:hypothetical protein
MSTETAHFLVLLLTYSILSMMQDTFRRMLEQFLADEILSARGKSEERARAAFQRRVRGMEKASRSMEKALIYCFPHARGFVLSLFAVSGWVLWPLSLALSIRSYMKTPETKEISDDGTVSFNARG